MRRLALALGIVLTLPACDLCDDDADCGGIAPITGDASDLSVLDAVPEGATVRAPRPCDDADLEAYALDLIHAGGTVADNGAWMVDRLRPALDDRRLYTGWGSSACYPRNIALIVDDWAEANEIAELAFELAAEDDVTVSVHIAIEEQAIPCAQRCDV
ncbi:MAG: hypothetical protein AAGA54_27170 [Myxococcota bacterium]